MPQAGYQASRPRRHGWRTEMASAISPRARVDGAKGAPQLRAGKRPRPGDVRTSANNTMQRRRRPFFDEQKWTLLEREQELEHRRVEEVRWSVEERGGCQKYTSGREQFAACLPAHGEKELGVCSRARSSEAHGGDTISACLNPSHVQHAE